MDPRAYSLIVVMLLTLSGLVIWSGNQASAVPDITGEFIASDTGVDADGNGLYEYLEVNMTLTSGNEGDHWFYTCLYNESGQQVAWKSVYQYLVVGTNTVTIRYNGIDINSSGHPGPYHVRYYVYDSDWVWTGWRDGGNLINNYTLDQFEHQYANATNYSYTTVDTGGDGYFDYLRLSMDINSEKEFNARIECYLYDGDGNYIRSKTIYVTIPTGTTTISMDFKGEDIYNHQYNGTYRIGYLYIWNDNTDNLVYRNSSYFLVTAPFTYDQFQPPDVEFGDLVTFDREDTDGDGLFDHLYVDVRLFVHKEGDYRVWLQFYDPSGNYIRALQSTSHYSVGVQTARLDMPGEEMFNTQQNGSFFGRYIRIYRSSGGNPIDYDNTQWFTPFYHYDEFQMPLFSLFGVTSDYGWDDPSDTNTLFDSLRINVSVLIGKVGDYRFRYELYNNGYFYTAWTDYYNYSTLGFQTITIDIPTEALWSWHYTSPGPYNWRIYRIEVDLPTSGINYYYPNYWTGLYDLNDFENPALMSDFSSRLIDTDNSGFYDHIDITVNLDVYEEGNYYVQIWVYVQETGVYMGHYTSPNTHYAVGPSQVTLSVPIYRSQIPTGGGHVIVRQSNLYRSGSLIQRLDNPHISSLISYDSLEPPAGMFQSISDKPIDEDGTIGIEKIMFTFTVNCYQSGNFKISFDMWDASMNYVGSFQSSEVYLTAGTHGALHHININVSATGLRNLEAYAPYYLDNIYLYYNGSVVDISSPYYSSYYTLSEYQGGESSFKTNTLYTSPRSRVLSSGPSTTSMTSMDLYYTGDTTQLVNIDITEIGGISLQDIYTDRGEEALTDTDNDGMLDIEMSPGDHLQMYLYISVPAIPVGSQCMIDLIFYWEGYTQYTKFTAYVGIGETPYEPVTPPSPPTGESGDSSGTSDGSGTSGTGGTGAGSGTSSSSGGSTNTGVGAKKTSQFYSSDKRVHCTVTYTGEGALSIKYTGNPSRETRRDGLGIYIEITAPETMTISSITIEVHYSDSDVPLGVDESDLSLYYWDVEGSKWVELPTKVDTKNNVLTTTVDHLTIFSAFRNVNETNFSNSVGMGLLIAMGLAIIIGIVLVVSFARRPMEDYPYDNDNHTSEVLVEKDVEEKNKDGSKADTPDNANNK